MAINQNLLQYSRKLRKETNPWEKKLWSRLRGSKFFNLKFKRQVVIGFYIVDFSCFEKKLIVELDGSQHAEDIARRNDEKRTKFLESRGYKVIRFWDNEINSNFEEVLESIHQSIQ